MVGDLVTDHPGFAGGVVARKFVVLLSHIALPLALLSVALALLLPQAAGRALAGRPLLALPTVEYEQNLRAAIWLMFAFAAAAGVTLAQRRLAGIEISFVRPRG